MTVLLLQTNRLRHKANYFKSNSRLQQLRAAALIAGSTRAFPTKLSVD
ncbi:hypothetical protein T06_5954 [Trichinella sp. T6]|nr:hypothetical protein T06_5954 [Trichinella sp. T6]